MAGIRLENQKRQFFRDMLNLLRRHDEPELSPNDSEQSYQALKRALRTMRETGHL